MGMAAGRPVVHRHSCVTLMVATPLTMFASCLPLFTLGTLY